MTPLTFCLTPGDHLDYHHRFLPATPEQCFLVDILVQSEWLLRRYRKVEAQLWTHEIDAAYTDNKKCPLGQAFDRGVGAFTRLQRRIDSAERNYHRALDKLQRFQSAPAAVAGPAPQSEPAPATPPPPAELASFHQIPGPPHGAPPVSSSSTAPPSASS